MIGSTISHYKILEKLGEGGMGVVYKAEDIKLKRLVALKFLPHQGVTKDIDRARLLQEAQAAALLNHPSICAIYGIHEDGDEQFIELEYVDGTTLRDKLPIKSSTEILDYAIQAAEALQEAHSKGIIHRDIKSENIMVNARGMVKVMDFGLAKLKGSAQLTQSSSTVGTLSYTAPEQVQGNLVDNRSDIFSFGVVLYEMTTGRLPFRGEHQASLVYSVVNEDPEPVEKLNPNTPPELAMIVSKALEKNPEDRYQSASEMVVDLKRARRKSSGISGIQTAQPATLSPQDTGTSDQPLRKRTRILILVASALLVFTAIIAGYFSFFKREERLDSLAVMPFVNATSDANLDYLSDGITESVISHLSRLSSLRVMSRNSVFRYKGKEIDPQEVGKTLGVRALLTGRMTQRPDGFSISLELVDTKDNRQIWGDQYIRSLASITSLETEIPREVTNHLRIEQSGEERENLSTASTRNSEAYELYLKGRFNWNKRLPEALRRAVDFFSQAIEKDPAYALAYTGLAETYVVMPVYIYPPPKDAFQQAKYYAMKALEINPRQAEAYSAMGNAKWSELDFVGAESDIQRATELNPRYATAHHWYALVLATSGRHSEAIEEARKATELDPLSLIIQSSYAIVLESGGRVEEAIQTNKKVLQTEPAFPIAHLGLGISYTRLARPADALTEFQKAQSSLGDIMLPPIASTYAMLGRTGETRTILKGLQASWKKGERVEAGIAMIYLALGEKDKAVEWLEKLRESKYINITQFWSLRDFPRLSGIDKDPKIQAALARIGVK